MTHPRTGNRGAQMRPLPVQTHRFSVGDLVQMSSILGQARVYRVTATLPDRDDSPQYRIRNEEERHERVAKQDVLEPVTSSHNTTLIERTFGNG